MDKLSRSQLQAHLKALKAELEKEYRKRLEAIDMVIAMDAANRKGLQFMPSQAEAKGQSPSMPSATGTNGMSFPIKEEAKKIILEMDMDTDISQPIISDKLNALFPEIGPTISRASLANALTRLQKDGILRLVREGKGRQPNIFRRKAPEGGDKN